MNTSNNFFYAAKVEDFVRLIKRQRIDDIIEEDKKDEVEETSEAPIPEREEIEENKEDEE